MLSTRERLEFLAAGLVATALFLGTVLIGAQVLKYAGATPCKVDYSATQHVNYCNGGK
jgi:hypothetical protein